MRAAVLDHAPARQTAPARARSEAPVIPSGPAPSRLRADAPAVSAAGLPEPVRELVSPRNPGTPLSRDVRAHLERTFGSDLAAVRVHDDARARNVVGAASARALTFGSHIFLGPRESAGDLRVVGHEVAHVVQQRGGVAPQRFTSSTGDSLENEAERASAAALTGGTFTISGRTRGARLQPLWDWVKRGIGAVAGAVAQLGAAAIEKALAFVRDNARRMPGYDLLAFVIGKDPITQEPVERSAVSLLRAAAGLIPGGQKLFDDLMRANVVQRAYEWFVQEVAALGLSWESIRGLFQRAWDALSVADLLDPAGAWGKLKSIFGPPLTRLRDFAAAAGKKLLELVFEGALALAGGAGQRVLALFRKIGSTFRLIVSDPIGFLRNLIGAVKGGFVQFGKNILDHLRSALFEWLTGALAGTIAFPERWDFKGIVSVILQILGLTYARLRQRLVKLIGEKAVSFIEGAFEFLKVLVTQGVAAAWQKILEFATGLADQVIAGIRGFVIERIVAVAVPRIANLLQPAGAVIEAIIGIYNTVMFVIEKARQLAAFVESVIDSISNIAMGNVAAAVNYVERTLGRMLSLLVSFLARYIGLGNVATKVQEVVKKIQGVVDRALDKLTDWIVRGAKALLDKVMGGGTEPAAQDPSARLEQGMAAGLAAVNRFAGKRIGKAILTPLLGAIRLRYRLKTLEVVPENGRWTLAGEASPRKLRPTEARIVADADGSREKPYPITWQKRPLRKYKEIWLAPSDKVGGRTPQSVIAKIKGAEKFKPWMRKPLPGDGETIGVVDAYQTRTSLRVGPKIPSPKRVVVTEFNKLLEKHGYDRTKGPIGDEGETDGDHVVELQVSGPDAFENLWPLNSSENRQGGSRLNTLLVMTEDGTEKRVEALQGKFFVIKDFAK